MEHDEWWDGVYEDFIRMVEFLGVTTEAKDMFFSGFCSQGDGASFSGRYAFVPDAVKKLTAETDDKELIRIASELTAMQVAQRLRGSDYFAASIRSSGHYSHSFTMNADIDDWGIDEVGEVDEEWFITLMRNLADWLYSRLEEEHDYLTSDEVVEERLADDLFTEDGALI